MQSVEIDSESQSTVETTAIMDQCYALWGVALQMFPVSFCDKCFAGLRRSSVERARWIELVDEFARSRCRRCFLNIRCWWLVCSVSYVRWFV